MLKGSEKQVRYAEDIKKAMLESLKELEEALKEVTFKKETTREKSENRIAVLKEVLSNYENAADIIEEHKEFLDLNKASRLSHLTKEYKISAKTLSIAQAKYADEDGIVTLTEHFW